MEKIILQSDWNKIDQMIDPTSFIDFMDKHNDLDRSELFETYRLTFGLLDIHKGDTILEVGCGTGDAVRTVSKLVGEAGKAHGLDKSQTMIKEAYKRAQGLGLPIEYHVGNAHDLPFASNFFDGCYALGFFEIADNPQQFLKEMVRVVRSKGRIVVPAGDVGTWAIDTSEKIITRKLLDFCADNMINGWIGRQLFGLFKELGVEEITPILRTYVHTDYTIASQKWLQRIVSNAQKDNIISATERSAWLNDLERRAHEGRFFLARTVFYVAGQKP